MSGPHRDRGRPKSASELMAELRNDPASVAQRKQQEDDRRTSIARYRSAARGVLAALAAVGCEVDLVGDLRKLGRPYPEAVPILVRWLPCVGDSSVKEDIVRTLSVPWASDAAADLVAAFERADDGTGSGLRWVIGNALEVVANDAVADGLMRIATNRHFGKAREMVVVGLGKLKDPRAVDVLLKLRDDDEVVGHAVMALGMLRTERARPRLEFLLEHPKRWVRHEARNAIRSIDNAR